MKITVIPIVFMFLASAMIIPIGMSYATYGDTPAFAPSTSTTKTTPAPATNQTMTNMTMHTPVTNQTMTNMTMHTPTPTANQTMTNMTTPAPATPTTTSTNTPSPSPSPLKQVKTGVAPKSVQCQSGFSLVLKAEDGSPACVKPSSVQILILRGWATVQ